MIHLFHGTNVIFDAIDPLKGRRGTDFGQGFYLTPNLESAKRMAQRVATRKGGGAVVMHYGIDESCLSNPDTGLYREGPVYLYDMLREERGLPPK